MDFAVMADPGLRSYLYSQAERSMQELLSKGVISPGGHAEVMKILASEQGGGQQMGYPGPYPGQPASYQNYQPPGQPPYQAYPMQQAYQAPPPQQQAPPPQPAVQPQNPPPEKHSSHLGDFGKRMGNNVVNGVSSGFGLTLGSDMANSLWHKL